MSKLIPEASPSGEVFLAERPVFIPDPDGALVSGHMVEFTWHPGFALAQKRRNIAALHSAAADLVSDRPLLEVSTKSPRALGARLSAFNLYLDIPSLRQRVPLEVAFQGSKVFVHSGQHPDIYTSGSGIEAKRAAQEYQDEPLAAFRFEGRTWPLEPTTAFYDWLYFRALLELSEQRPMLTDEIKRFGGFTDIEFNPKRSLNCQARSCALFVALASLEKIQDLVMNPDRFIQMLLGHGYGIPPGPLTLL